MGLHRYEKLVPELGEMVIESDQMWLGIGAGRVLLLRADEFGKAWVGFEPIYEDDRVVGVRLSAGHRPEVGVADGYKVVEVHDKFTDGPLWINTPLGAGWLCVLQKVEE